MSDRTVTGRSSSSQTSPDGPTTIPIPISSATAGSRRRGARLTRIGATNATAAMTRIELNEMVGSESRAISTPGTGRG